MKFRTSAFIVVLMLALTIDVMPDLLQKKKPVLNEKLMARFLIDFPSLVRELAAYSPEKVQAFEAFIQEGAAVQNIDLVRSDIETAMKDPGVRKIIEKHGWGAGFGEIYMAVFTAYSIFIAEDLFKASSDPAMSEYILKWKPSLHPGDLEIVQKNRSKLEKMILSTADSSY